MNLFPRFNQYLSSSPFFRFQEVVFDKIRLFFSFLLLISVCSACRSPEPILTTTPSAPETTFLPSPETPVVPGVTSSSTPTLASTATVEQILTPTPTAFPSPSYPVMGLELTGGNFVTKVPLAAEAGAGWIRYNGIRWDKLEPQEGVRDWTQAIDLEARSQAVAQAGMNLIAIVLQTPSWAQEIPGHSCGAISPEKLEAYGQFMYDLVSRYSQSPYNIHYWELGNEPDIDPADVPATSAYGCWGDKTDAYYGGGYYAEMLKAVYPQIKSADPQAQVLLGGLLLSCDPENPPLSQAGDPQDCSSTRFLEGILRAGGGSFFDGISFHAYDYYQATGTKYGNAWRASPNLGYPVVYYKTHFLRDLLYDYGYPNKFLINTETALLCGRDQNEPYCQTDEYHETKAGYVVQSYAIAKGENLRANIWYYYQKGWRASGLVGGDLQPYPSLQAYQFVGKILSGALSWVQVTEYSNVTGYKFIQPTPQGYREIWIIWSADGNSTPIALPEIPAESYDTLGEPLVLTQMVEANLHPLYLIWNR